MLLDINFKFFFQFPLVIAIISMSVAQLIKCGVCLLRYRRVSLEDWFSSGGMPSSHSAMVSGLSGALAIQYGVLSPYFSIAFVLSCIVLYDSAGVRRIAGNLAVNLNQLLKQCHLNLAPVKEINGHTPLEVFVGVLIGLCVSLFLLL